MVYKIDEDVENAVKGVSITPAITALLKPTADYLGAELRNYIKEAVDVWKAKRRESNVNAHLKCVREKLASEHSPNLQGEPTFEQLDLLDHWIENVQDIDPENVELSEIWRNLLARSALGGNTPTEVIKVLKTLTPREASFLSEFHNRAIAISIFPSAYIPRRNRYLAKALESKGILERDSKFLISLLLLILALISISYAYIDHLKVIFIPQPILLFATGTTVSFMLAIFFGNVLSQWHLSWLGEQLIRLVKGKISK